MFKYCLIDFAKIYALGGSITFLHVSHRMYVGYNYDRKNVNPLGIKYFIKYIPGSTIAWPLYWITYV